MFDVNFFSQVTYNTFSCLVLCSSSVGLCCDVNFVRKRVDNSSYFNFRWRRNARQVKILV
ncbi:hypothetical protein Hanom_Chr16g01511201 [Helianthus anomalus]